MSMSNAIIGERVHMDGLYLKLLKEKKNQTKHLFFLNVFFCIYMNQFFESLTCKIEPAFLFSASNKTTTRNWRMKNVVWSYVECRIHLQAAIVVIFVQH